MRSNLKLVLSTCLALTAACGGDDPMGMLAAPTLDAFDSPTNQSPIALTGLAEAGALVTVRGGAEAVASATAGADGAFSVDVALRPDADNTLLVSQELGGEESPSVMLMITHDGMAPNTPRLDPVASPTRNIQPILVGEAEPGALVTVSGGAEAASGSADSVGRFSIEVTLNSAVASITENNLELIAQDAAGNESGPLSVTIVHNPNIAIDAPMVDAVPSHVNEQMLTLTGQSEPDVSITVAGATAPVMVMTNATGAFTAEVELRANASNSLSVFAVIPETGLSSPPFPLVVIHDDVAPGAPDVDPTASPTGAEMIRLTGRSERLAQIAITGAAAPVMLDADEDGVFSATVMLSLDALNELSITATDIAGNTGDATLLAIEQDSSLEAPVTVDPTASPTATNPITLTGLTEASVMVEITGGASPVMVTSMADGTFSASVTLTANARNELRVRRVAGTVDTILVIEHDDMAPAAPRVDPLASPTNRTNITVAGASEPNARISVSGGMAPATATANEAGRFSASVRIPEDSTTALSVIATDRAGNSSSPTAASVTHSSTAPDAPVVDNASPQDTNMATHTVTGRVLTPGPGISVRITGGASTAMGDTDESTGSFSIEVTLNANAENELTVISVEGAIESPPALVNITHDDIAPDAPVGESISLGNPMLATCLARTETINVTGGLSSVEAFASVRVLNVTAGTVNTTVAASGDGSFAARIAACAGDVLRITAADAATNVSAATEKTVMR